MPNRYSSYSIAPVKVVPALINAILNLHNSLMNREGNNVGLFSYIDAGTGSLFIQAIIGIFLAGGLFFRTQFARIASKVRSLFSSKTTVNDKE